MTSKSLIGAVAMSLMFVVALSVLAPRPAAASDDWAKLLAGAAVGYLVYQALDNADHGCGYGNGYGYGYSPRYCPPPPVYYRPEPRWNDGGWGGDRRGDDHRWDRGRDNSWQGGRDNGRDNRGDQGRSYRPQRGGGGDDF